MFFILVSPLNAKDGKIKLSGYQEMQKNYKGKNNCIQWNFRTAIKFTNTLYLYDLLHLEP
jgi:hypothetical protein